MGGTAAKVLFCSVAALGLLISIPVLASEPLLRYIDVGYWDIWRHADGVTWQYTGRPGDLKEYAFNLETPAVLANYHNISYKIIAPVTEAGYLQAGGYLGMNYTNFYICYQQYTPQGYQKKDDKTVSLRLEGTYFDIKKEWQGQLVEGRRWYLPVVVEWYGEVPPQAEPPEELPCYQGSSISNTWEELYIWEVSRSSTTTDPLTGETTTEYWTETKWATPTYRETLSAELMVNTKQGIKNGGRESRGAWEIMPWATAQGLNPNEVTRSGYGLEVKVRTHYTTDWETKIPSGAGGKGGSFQGATKVTADFHDTGGRFVERVQLVPTAGRAGDREITWELPKESYTFSDGTTVSERKHYTDVSIPNGKYLVRVSITGAGKTGLCLIQKKNITIYKDLWEDSFTRPSTREE
jgi:hypothetical protein